MAKVNIGIVGAGVIGLTTAVHLLENGFNDVTLISKDLPLATNSDAAVATWYAPDNNKPNLQRLCFATLPKLATLSLVSDAGVSFIPVAYYFKNQAEYFASGLCQALGKKLIALRQEYMPPVSTAYPVVVVASIPLMDVPIYRPYLFSQFRRLGGKLVKQKIHALTEMTNDYEVVINCTGWEAKQLANDSLVLPARGQIEVASMPPLSALPLSLNVAALNVYAVFRPGSGDYVIGTTYQIDNASTRASAEDRLTLLKKIAPLLPAALTLTTRSVVGIRCERADLRLDQELIVNENKRACLLVHCYGHAGSGFSSSWGSAYQVLEHVLEYCKQK
jgi:D-amino-acid oxidase